MASKPKPKPKPKPKKRAARKPAEPKGPNAAAIDKTLAELRQSGRLEKIDAARIQAVRSIAAVLDSRPGNSQMWREYRESLEGLTRDDDDDGAIAEVIQKLQAAPRDTKKT